MKRSKLKVAPQPTEEESAAVAAWIEAKAQEKIYAKHAATHQKAALAAIKRCGEQSHSLGRAILKEVISYVYPEPVQNQADKLSRMREMAKTNGTAVKKITPALEMVPVEPKAPAVPAKAAAKPATPRSKMKGAA